MLEFPYMHLPGGMRRPMIAVVLEGPKGRRLLDGLLDTGADRTLFPRREAQAVGVSLPLNPSGWIRTAGAVSIPYRLTHVVLELRAGGQTIRWKSAVAFADSPLNIIHLGHHGFLEFFCADFRGPEGKVLLLPQNNLPPP